ncbi:MAG: primosomal protein N', partial [Gammaproteobacteria bacterium]
ERRQSGWPPFSHLAMIRSESTQRDLGHELLSRIRQLAAKYGSADVLVLGPAAAPMERRAGRYRAQLLFQARERGPLHVLLQKLVPAIPDFPGARRVRWSVDVDPVELF